MYGALFPIIIVELTRRSGCGTYMFILSRLLRRQARRVNFGLMA